MVLQKGQGRAATVETEPLERRELIQPRKGQRDPEREPRPGAVLEPTKVIHHVLASMEKDINDETRIGPNENVGGDEYPGGAGNVATASSLSRSKGQDHRRGGRHHHCAHHHGPIREEDAKPTKGELGADHVDVERAEPSRVY